MSSVARKMNEKNALKAKNADRLAATSVRFLTAAAGTSGARDRASIHTNDASSSAAAANSSSVVDRGPAVLGAPVQAVDEEQQSAGHRGRTGDIEVPRAARSPVGSEERGGEADEHDADRDVDEEHPAPAGAVGQQAAGDHAHRCRGATHGAEDAQGAVALLPLGEGDGQDRQRRRRHESGAEPLEPSRRDEHGRRLGDARDERRRREDRHPGEEHPSSPEQVGHPAAEEEKSPEQQPVGDDHPLQGALADVRSCWMDGRATFTIAMSSTTMNWAAHTRARITPDGSRCRGVHSGLNRHRRESHRESDVGCDNSHFACDGRGPDVPLRSSDGHPVSHWSQWTSSSGSPASSASIQSTNLTPLTSIS